MGQRNVIVQCVTSAASIEMNEQYDRNIEKSGKTSRSVETHTIQ